MTWPIVRAVDIVPQVAFNFLLVNIEFLLLSPRVENDFVTCTVLQSSQRTGTKI